jgi:hypothetical protein
MDVLLFPVALSDFRIATPPKCTVPVRIEDHSGNQIAANILIKYFPDQFWHTIAELDARGTAMVPVVGPDMMIVASRDIVPGEVLRSGEWLIESCPLEGLRLRLTETVKLD